AATEISPRAVLRCFDRGCRSDMQGDRCVAPIGRRCQLGRAVRIARIKQNFFRGSSLRPSRLCGLMPFPFVHYRSYAVPFFCLPFPLFLRCFVVQPAIFLPVIREAYKWASFVSFCSHPWLRRFRLWLC